MTNGRFSHRIFQALVSTARTTFFHEDDMAVFCSECGEKLLGAVNRCWNCGREFELLANEATPPVRRAPVCLTPSDEAVVAQPAVENAANTSTTNTSTTNDSTTNDSSEAAAISAAVVAAQVRRGSPFAGAGEGIALRRALRTQYPAGSASRSAAMASVVVGGIALAASFFTVGGILIGMIGLCMGVWGLYSDRRAVAIAGTVLSCFALAIACFHGAVYLYIFIYGMDPFPPEIPEMEFPL